MTSKIKSPRTLTLLIACLAVGACAAAVALANVTIYTNTFKTRPDAAQIKKSSGGKPCKRRWRSKSEKLLVTVDRGERLCSYRPPVTGANGLPDHEVKVITKILKSDTAAGVRTSAYVTLAIRVANDSRYQLEIRPAAQRFKLTRKPDNDKFPISGKSTKIKRLDGRNGLRLRAFGTKIRAYVNGKLVASANEQNPGAVQGRRIEFGLGNHSTKRKPVVGTFDGLEVSVPNP